MVYNILNDTGFLRPTSCTLVKPIGRIISLIRNGLREACVNQYKLQIQLDTASHTYRIHMTEGTISILLLTGR